MLPVFRPLLLAPKHYQVARLRSAGPDNDKSMSSSACSERFGRDRDALQNARSGRGYTSTHVAHPSPARTICNTNESPEAQEAPANGKEWRAPAQAMSDPNCHVPRLEVGEYSVACLLAK